MTTTMRETETDGNRETANIFRVAGCLREEVDRRVGLDADYAERERTMHEVANEVMRCVQQQDL